MATQTIYRKANISTADARKSLQRAFPKGKIASIEVVAADADAASAARVSVGDLVYQAVVHVAEFPPSNDGGDSDGDSGDDASTPPKKKEEGGDSDSGDGGESDSDGGDSDSGGDSDGGGDNPFGGGDEGDGGAPKLKGDDGIIHLLTEILHALKPAGPDAGLDPNGPGGPGLDGPVPPGGPAGPGDPGALPDVGAPPAGGPPLPPPVPEKPGLGGPAFAHYDPSKSEFSVLRRDATEGNKALIAEAADVYPTHKVAKIQRTGSAKINGLTVDLPANNVAVVTLIRK